MNTTSFVSIPERTYELPEYSTSSAHRQHMYSIVVKDSNETMTWEQGASAKSDKEKRPAPALTWLCAWHSLKKSASSPVPLVTNSSIYHVDTFLRFKLYNYIRDTKMQQAALFHNVKAQR